MERNHNDSEKKEEDLITIRTEGISEHSMNDIVQHGIRHPRNDTIT